jgi:hypothetical protein
VAEDRKIDDAGMAAAASMGLQVYEHACRGSGRTHRMIMALKNGETILTHERGDWFKNMVRELRGPGFKVRIVSCDGTWDGLLRSIRREHLRSPVAMDHYLLFHLHLDGIKQTARHLAELGVNQPVWVEQRGEPPPASSFFQERYDG